MFAIVTLLSLLAVALLALTTGLASASYFILVLSLAGYLGWQQWLRTRLVKVKA
jgi:hypothetical protein